MRYYIHSNGSFDLIGTNVSLVGCYPAADGIALRPTCVKVFENIISYALPEGTVRVRFDTDRDGRIALHCSASGIADIHDISPLASGKIRGADQVYIQGFGMEGPSGFFPVDADAHTSYGLTALFADTEALLLYAEDHRRYGTSFSISQMKTLHKNAAVLAGTINLEGTAGGSWEAPSIFLEEACGREEALRHCASRIASAMHARKVMPPAFFWSGWYYAYETMDKNSLRETIAGIRAEKVPFQYLEIDAGYCDSPGDWLIPNHRWPGGLGEAAEMILEAGFKPGIWVAPFIVGDRSRLYREHPDWVLKDLDGKPVVRLRSYTEPKLWGIPDCNYYVLDASHPGALAYLGNVFSALKGWGFSFFKTDFMLWNMYDTAAVCRYNPAKTSVEILRDVLRTVREAIGEESYLLGCIAPFMPFIGFADGMRIAGDCGAQWAEAYGPVNLLREVPCGSYFNHIFWQNDPDAMMLRDFDTMLEPEEVFSLALLQALSGGAVSTSDPVERLGDDRKKLLRFVEPHGCVTPGQPGLGSGRELVLTHVLPQGNLLFVMNPTEEPLVTVLKVSELVAEAGRKFIFRMERIGEGSHLEGDLIAETLAPHKAVLYFVTGRPLEAVPENLWIW